MRISLLLALLLNVHFCFSQIENYTVYVYSNTNSQGPTNVTWQVKNQSNTILFSGTLSFNAEINSYSIPIELNAGCYQLRLIGNGVSNPNSFFGNIQQNGNALPPTVNLSYGTQVFEYPFCTNIVQEECQAFFEIEYLGNGLVQLVNQSTPLNDLVYSWYLGQGVIESQEVNPSFQFTANGVYTICLEVSSFFENTLVCSDEYCLELVVEDYFNSDCPNDFFSSGDCANWIFELNNAGPSSVVTWNFSGVEITGGHFIEYTFPESGVYQVCATTTSENCPEGAQICKAIEVNDCGSQNCSIEIVALNMGNGVFEFTAFGSPEVYPMYWSFGDGTTLAATWVVEHIFTEPGVYEVCGSVQAPACGIPVGDCVAVEVNATNPCTEVTIAIDSFVSQGGATFFEYNLINESSSESVASGVAQYSANDPYFDLPICLEDGCYSLVVCTGNIDFTWDAVNVISSGGLMVNGWDSECGGNGRVYHLSLNSKCGQGCLANEVELLLNAELPQGISVPVNIAFYSDLVETFTEVLLNQSTVQQLELCVPSDCYNLVIDVLTEEEIFGQLQIIANGSFLQNIPFEIPSNLQFNLENIPIGLPIGVDCFTGVSENELQLLTVFPNPSNGVVTILGVPAGIVEVYDTCGKRVTFVPIGNDRQIDLSILPKGLYMLRSNHKSALFILE